MHVRALCLTAIAASLVTAGAASAQTMTVPPSFEAVTLATGLPGAVSVAWAPDGRMLVGSAAGGGAIYIFNPGAKTPSAVRNVTNNVYGIAVDSEFASNGYLYVARTHGGNTTQRLTRVTLKPDNTFVNPASPETVLLGSVATHPCPPPSNTNDCITAETPHDLNSVVSDPRDGTLWVANGDESRVGGSEAVKAYNEQSYAGKILHIDRNGRGLPGHPFCPTDTDLTHVCTKVYAKGFKNPFRFTLGSDGAPLVGEVGWGAYEEIDRVLKGGNYGWPCYEGPIRTPGFRDNPACAPEYAKEGTAAADIGPLFAYPFSRPGVAVVAGPTYTGKSGYPVDYNGDLFYADYVQRWIKRLKLDSTGKAAGTVDFATNAGPIVDLQLSPNGNLVMVTIDGKVTEFRYTGSGNRAPTARASADKTSGPAPLTVNFRGADSSDPDGDALRYDWDFGDGSAHGTVANPTHVYPASTQVRLARLTVTDPDGATDTATIEISPGNQAPTVTINAPTSYRDGQRITATGSATDPEDGTLPTSALTWHTALVHGTHVHDPDDVTGVSTVEAVVPTDHDADTYYEFTLSATDSRGATSTKTVKVGPETRQITLASVPTGSPVSYADGDFVTPFSKQAAIGFLTPVSAAASFSKDGHTYVFDSWSDGQPRSHNITIPASDLTLTARYRQEDGGSGGGTTVGFEAETMAGVVSRGPAANIANPSASAGRSVRFTTNARITKTLTLPAGLDAIKLRARGALCDGPPVMSVTIDGRPVMDAPVDSPSLTDYSASFDPLAAGQHTIAIVYSNDFVRPGCDRTLEVDLVTLSGAGSPPPPPPPPGGTILEAETMSGVLSSGMAQGYLDATASGGRAVRFFTNVTITKTLALPAFSGISVRAAGSQCNGAPAFAVKVDGVQVAAGSASTTGFSDYTTAVSRPAGTRTVAVSFVNDATAPGCDRNLKVDKLTFSP